MPPGIFARRRSIEQRNRRPNRNARHEPHRFTAVFFRHEPSIFILTPTAHQHLVNFAHIVAHALSSVSLKFLLRETFSKTYVVGRTARATMDSIPWRASQNLSDRLSGSLHDNLLESKRE